MIDPRQRDRRLQELLKQYHGARRQNRVIVFVLYKKEAARVEQVGCRMWGLTGAVPHLRTAFVVSVISVGASYPRGVCTPR